MTGTSSDSQSTAADPETRGAQGGMFGYWAFLLMFALATTALFGPGLHEALPPGVARPIKWLVVPGILQHAGIASVAVLGFCLRNRVRGLQPRARPWAGVVLGCLSLPFGFAYFIIPGIVARLFTSV